MDGKGKGKEGKENGKENREREGIDTNDKFLF